MATLALRISIFTKSMALETSALLSIAKIDGLKRETAAISHCERGNIEGMLAVETNESDVDVLKKYVAIHFPHKISPAIHTYLPHQKIVTCD